MCAEVPENLIAKDGRRICRRRGSRIHGLHNIPEIKGLFINTLYLDDHRISLFQIDVRIKEIFTHIFAIVELVPAYVQHFKWSTVNAPQKAVVVRHSWRILILNLHKTLFFAKEPPDSGTDRVDPDRC